MGRLPDALDCLDCAITRPEIRRRKAGDVEDRATQPFRVAGIRADLELEAVGKACVPVPPLGSMSGDRIRQPMPFQWPVMRRFGVRKDEHGSEPDLQDREIPRQRLPVRVTFLLAPDERPGIIRADCMWPVQRQRVAPRPDKTAIKLACALPRGIRD